MNLFKKVIASIALTTLMLSMITTGASAAGTAELTAANKLAADGIINDNTANPANYNLGDNVLRQEIAKVAANIAGLTPNATCSNKFSDVSATTPNTWACGYVEALLDAGLVSANPKFNPEANISKAEALKMMLEAAGYSNVYTDAANWQAETVAFAVQKSIITSFSDYNAEANRGWIFSVASDARDSMNTGGDLLGALLGDLGDVTPAAPTTNPTTPAAPTTTPAAPTVSAAADVTVSLNPDSLANGTQVPSNGVVRFAKVDFTAGSEDASLNTVKVSKVTLASVPSGTRVWFEKDGRRVSGKAAFSSDNTAIVSFAPSYVVMAGETATLDLYVQLASTTGNDFQFKGELTSASVTVNGSFTTPLLSTADYTVAPVVISSLGSNTTYNDLSSVLELGKFKLQNFKTANATDIRDIKINSLTLRQLGDASLSNLSDVYIERNGSKISTSYVIDGKYITFTLNDTLKDSTTATYYVRGMVSNVDNNAGDKYKFELKKDTDLNAIESLNGFRSSVYSSYTDANTNTIANNVSMFEYTVNGSDIIFSRDTSVELSTNVAKGTNNVTLMKGIIKSTSAITLEDPTIAFTNSISSTGANDLFNTVYLKIGSTIMTWTPTATDTSAKFLGLATLPAGENTVEVYADLKDTAPTATFKLDDLRLSSFAVAEYASNQNTINSSVGTVSGVSVSIDTTTVTITKVDGLGDTTLASGSKGVLLNKLSLKVNTGNDVSVSNPIYTVTYSGSAQNNVFLTLYSDGVAVSTKTVNVTSGNTIAFQNLNKIVNSVTPVTLSVKADLSDAYTGGTFSVKLTGLDITDTLTSNTVTLPTISNSASFTVAQSEGQLAVSSDTINSKLLLAGNTSEKLMSFSVKARNDDIRLRDLAFTGVNLGALNNFKVVDANNNTVAIATTNNATAVTFSNLNVTDVISKDSTNTYYLVADVNSNSTATGVSVTLSSTGTKIKGTNGNIYNIAGVSSLTSNTHRVEENMAVVAKEVNPSADLPTSALRFSVAATGKDSVTLTGITLNTSISNYTGATDITVYKDTVSNVVGTLTGTTTTLNGSNIVVPFTANNIVNAGTTSHYYIVINGATLNGNVTASWTVSIQDVTVNAGGTNGVVSVKNYSNMGTLPLTEAK